MKTKSEKSVWPTGGVCEICGEQVILNATNKFECKCSWYYVDAKYVVEKVEEECAEIKALRIEAIFGPDNADEKKKQLLAMVSRGEPRPSVGEHSLGSALSNYTCPSSGSFDPEFNQEIRKVCPNWFVNTAENKKQLLALARRGEPRSTARKHLLGNPLSRYTNENSNCFDSEFNQQIRELRPDWFVNTDEEFSPAAVWKV